jgi:CRISPR/Cas system-associated endonuclease Cas3-HD
MEESSVRFGMSLLEIFENDVRQFLDQKEVEALKKAVNEIKSRGAENLMRSLEVNVNSRVNSLWREIMQRRDLKKLSYLTLIVLTTADYLSAQKNRNLGKSRFSRVLDEFNKFYLL